MKSIMSVVAALVASSVFCDEAAEFARGLNEGADAKIMLRIVDGDGVPVPDADVEFGFWNNYSQGGFKNFFLHSDTNGECVVSGRCTGSCVWNVTKHGYYRSHAEWSLSSTDAVPKVSEGKWRPYGATRTILLKRIVSPADLSCHDYRLVKCPLFDEWIGFDLELCSWVKPYGKGLHSDVLMRLHESNGDGNAFSSTLELCFTNNPFAGAYVRKKDTASEMKSVYHADTNTAYQSEFRYSLSVDNCGRRTDNKLSEDSYLVFRTRTKVDDHGNLISAHYGKIYGEWGFYGGMRAEAFFFNTNSNDPNLEDLETAERSRRYLRQLDEKLKKERNKK